MSDNSNFFKIIAAVIITVISIIEISAQEKTQLRWEAVHGSGGYILEIRNSQKKVIVEEELKVTEYDISKLSTGDYQYRLTTLNKLKKKGSSTGWMNLSIEKAVIPVLTGISQKFLGHSYENPPFTVTGKDFLQDTKLYLKNESQKIDLNTAFITSGELKAALKKDEAAAGIFDLVAVNRGGFETVMPSAVEIIAPDIPVLEMVSQGRIYNSIETKLSVKGKNFNGDILLFAEDDKGNKIKIDQQTVSDNEISITLKPAQGYTGRYKLSAVKRNYFPSAGKLQIEISDPPFPVLETVSQKIIYNSVETKISIKGKNLSGDVAIIGEDQKGNRIKIIQQNISDNEIVITINPAPAVQGIYELTAVKQNIFKSQGKLQIEIVNQDIPVMESISQNTVFQAVETLLVIKGKNLGGNVVLNIQNSNGEKINFIQKSISENEMNVTIRPSLFDKGDYIVTAVKNNTLVSQGRLKFSIIEPELTKTVTVLPDSISVSRGKFVLKLDGGNIHDKTGFDLRSDSTILRPYKVSVSGKSVYLYFEEEKYQGGEYSLHYENKSRQSFTHEKKIPVNDASTGLFGLNVITFGAGLDYNVLKNDWTSYLDSRAIGFHIYLSYPLSSVYFTRNIPVLKNLGLEAFYNYSDYHFLNGTGSEYFTRKAGYIGLNYPVRLSFITYRLSLIFNLDAGTAYSLMNILSNEQYLKYSSFDFSVKGGVSLRYEWFNYVFSDISAEYLRVFYLSQPMDEAKISIRAGVML